MKKKYRKNGFTLVELIVVMIIILILAAILIPSLIKYIDRAHEKGATIECRQCVMAANTLLMENYTGAESTYTFDFDKCKELAEVPGIIESANADSRAALKHLIYSSDKYTVYYCKEGGCSACGNSQEYTITKKGVDVGNALSKRMNLEIASVFKDAMTLTSGQHIDGKYQHEDGRQANMLYNKLNSEQQAYIDNVNWVIYQDNYGWRMYMTTENYGSDATVSNIPILKYDPATNKYQYGTNGKITNGILSNGATWHNSEWYDYDELPDEVKIKIE